MLSEQTMYLAVSTRDRHYDSQFVYGVITTGVFCCPSCPSRLAKPENIRYFDTIQAALLAGFRPCKRCQQSAYDQAVNSQNTKDQGNKDQGARNQITEAMIEVARYIQLHAEQSISLAHLADQFGGSPSSLQRAFKGALGISPKAYQNAVRMRRFKDELKAGEGVTDAIFSAGFSSVSRIYGETDRGLGMSPKSYQTGAKGERIYFACRETILGWLMMAATEKGVCYAEFGDTPKVLNKQLMAEFPKAEFLASLEPQRHELDDWIDALNLYLSDAVPLPDIPLDLRGTAFQVRVWQLLLTVQHGEVLSYSQLAERLGKPKAVRAVASACGKNKVGILVPCHRILRSDGSLGGYRWGLDRKEALLAAEAISDKG